VEIDGNTGGHEGFRQVQTSMKIITLHHVFLVYYEMLVSIPPYPSFYILREVGFTRKI
jgi:hypothetical protein